jgi:hypothetical protein
MVEIASDRPLFKTFRDFPRGLCDLLQSVAQIYIVYI